MCILASALQRYSFLGGLKRALAGSVSSTLFFQLCLHCGRPMLGEDSNDCELGLQVKGSQCFTKYHWRSPGAGDQGPVIVATQVGCWVHLLFGASCDLSPQQLKLTYASHV